MKKYDPKSDAQLNTLFVSLYGEPTDRTFGEFERRVEAFSETFRQAESELLPLLNASEERVRCLEEELKGMTWVADSNGKYYEEEKAKNEAMIAELKELKIGGEGCQCFYTYNDIQSIITKYNK